MTYRPDLSVGGQSVGDAANDEVQVLQGSVLGGRDTEQTGAAVKSSTSGALVLLESIWQILVRLGAIKRRKSNIPEAIRMRVVPVSTIPAVLDKMVVEPP